MSMAWFRKEKKPRLPQRERLEIPPDAWEKCEACGHTDLREKFARNLNVCPNCDYQIRGDYLRCPSCLYRLKEPCGACGKPLDPRWKICPYCEAEVGTGPPPEPTVSRRRRRREEETMDFPAP